MPVLRLLKASYPAARIYWWISAELAELLEGDPDLAGLILFHRRKWASPAYWGEIARSMRALRDHRFDLAIDLQGLARSSIVAWLTRSEFTVGLEDWREGAAGLYDRAVPRPSVLTHAVDWYLEVLKALDVPVHWEFDWLPRREAVAQSVQNKWKPSDARWVMIVPGARWSNKRWPAAYYRDLVCELAHMHPDLRFAILGGRSDSALGAEIQGAIGARCLDLTGQTTLAEMVEWIRLSAHVITNDTGPMHIAAALNKPLTSIFGPTEPRRTGPYGRLNRVVQIALPCAPCLKPVCHWPRPVECLHGISPSMVLQRVLESLAAELGRAREQGE